MARRYDVALSFAGEDRHYVEQVAQSLSDKGVRVFYDAYEAATLWGKDLYVHFDEIYQRRSRFMVMFISASYAEKLWTNHERRSAQARAFSERGEYVLPARFDDTEVPGLPRTIGFVDLRNKSPDDLATLITEKVRSTNVTPPRHQLLDQDEPTDDLAVLSLSCADREWSAQKIGVDPLQYSSFGSLLDEVYSVYLARYLKPFTYGQGWIIIGEPFDQRLLVPWQWVLHPGMNVSLSARPWMKTPLSALDFIRGSRWTISAYNDVPGIAHEIMGSEFYYLGVDDEEVWKIVRDEAKAVSLLSRRVLAATELTAESATRCRYGGVFADWLNIGQGVAWMQVAALDESERSMFSSPTTNGE